jgi:hypothetical protein
VREIVDTIQKKKDTYWVIQKYIEKPLLYHTRKFDIRVWVLLTDDFCIHFYREGYLRTSSAEYDCQKKDNLVHLTNQCLQVNDKEQYGQHEEGNTLTFKQF